MELNQKQKDIIGTTFPKVVAVAAAASGKTRTLTERVRHLVRSGENKKRIVVITFTRLAANEMSERLGEDGKGIFIGTIHSYAAYLLLSGGVDSARDFLDKEEFDMLFSLIKTHKEVLQPVDHLLLDEAQDSDELQFDFVLSYVKPKNFIFFGDLRQCIYQFNGSRPDILRDIMDRPDVRVMPLNENYRNSREVFEFARWLIRPLSEDDSIIMSKEMGKVELAEYSPELIKRIGRTIPSADYGKWFILCRTNAQVDTIKNILIQANVPCESFKRSDFSTMNELSKKLETNTIKIMTIHASKGLESDNVIVFGARYFQDEERRLSYVAATRARKKLWWLNTPKKKSYRSKSWI